MLPHTRAFQHYKTFRLWEPILPNPVTPHDIHQAELLLQRNYVPALEPEALPRGNESPPAQTSQSSFRAIAVMGDIRKSQDLMTYADSPTDFARNIKEFLDGTRDLIGSHYGLFDKFTGDGFLAYFDQGFCAAKGQDFIACFARFIQEEHDFAAGLFARWEQQARKLPAKQVGLAIGADIGRVAYTMEAGHFVVVGDAIVWAARMASEAKAGELVVNNLLYQQLRTLPGLAFDMRVAHTKGL